SHKAHFLHRSCLACICAPSSISCLDENLRISGGSYAFSKDGSIVRYSCSEGYYPTVRIRRTQITCPDPRGFENGEKYPNQRQHFVNDTTHYSCHTDFCGLGTRVFQANMKLSGGTTETVSGKWGSPDLCPDPGIPAGCTRTGHMFNIKLPGRRSNMATHCSGCVFMVCVCSLLTNSLHFLFFFTSDSIEEEDFEKAKGVIKTLIENISYYEVSPNYEILNFCHRRYMDSLQEGLQEANERILESMKIEQMENKKEFQQTQHIIMLTDGQANMGGNARPWVDQIKDLVNKILLHSPVLLSFEYFILKLVELVLSLMFLQSNNGKFSNCVGSLVTSSFILTAAHCFMFEDTPDRITVDMGSDIKGIKVKDYIPHPRYDVAAKQKMGIPEYYEFDVALIQLNEPVIMGIGLWQICIPYTKETSGALRLSDREGTCRKIMSYKQICLSEILHVY
uniref:Complement factor b, like n=1 Tax=Sinocyclocheilus anshuiensis TaxID=1608454 RepID=A0A671SDM4_9TELE